MMSMGGASGGDSVYDTPHGCPRVAYSSRVAGQQGQRSQGRSREDHVIGGCAGGGHLTVT
eukprot:2067528-Rhodomonas_salina.1